MVPVASAFVSRSQMDCLGSFASSEFGGAGQFALQPQFSDEYKK